MSYTGNLRDQPTNKIRELTKIVRNEIATKAETTSTIMYAALLFDTTVHQHSDGAKAYSIKHSLNQEGITDEMIQVIVAFSQQFCAYPSSWFKSHNEKMSSSASAAQSWTSKSEFNLPSGGSCSYKNLWVIAEKILKSKTMSTMVISPKPSRGTEWEGGTLQQYIAARGADILVVVQSSVHVKRVKRLSDNGRKILRGIMKQVGNSHGSQKYYNKLSTETIYLIEDLNVILPPPTSSKQEDFKTDYVGLRNVVVAMIENTGNPGRQYPEDVKHLRGLLRRDGYPKESLTIFNHSVLWTPSEVVKNVSAMRLHIMLKRSDKIFQGKLQDLENLLKTEVHQWSKHIPSNTIYETTYNVWQQEIAYYKGGDVSVSQFFTKVKTRNALSVLFFMRNCYPHVNQNHASQTSTHLDGGMIETDLYVMFPGFLSAFYTAAIPKDLFDENLCKIGK